MKVNSNYFCSICNEQLEIENGDLLFTYKINCLNGHKNNNIFIDDLLLKKGCNEKIYKCQKHSRKIMAHCSDCKRDICFNCLNEEHKKHKADFLKALNANNYQIYHFKSLIENEKNILNLFLSNLKVFQSKLISHINMIKSLLRQEFEFKTDIIEKILNKTFTNIDIQNAKGLLDDNSYRKINKSISDFCKSKTFIEEYNSLKNIFEEVIEKGKYIENKYFSKIREKFNLNLIPLNNNYYICLNKDSNNLDFIRDISKPNSLKFEYETLFYQSFTPNNVSNIEKIILKNNEDVEKELSFFFIENNYRKELYEMKITNLLRENGVQSSKIRHINLNNYNKELQNFIILSDKNYVIADNEKICLYDNLFNINKIIVNDNKKLRDLFAISNNSFVYSVYEFNQCYYITDVDNDLIGRIPFNSNISNFINYFEKRKILIGCDEKCLYLINFNIPFPEVIQKLEITDLKVPESHLYYLSEISFNHLDKFYALIQDNDYFFIKKKQYSYENGVFYNVIYIIQYTLLNNELKEISRTEIFRDKAKKKYCD